MSTDSRELLASRTHLLLRRELGQGIEVQRMLAEPLYARDVLLVCDALPGSELAMLAQQFRQAGPVEAGSRPSRASGSPQDSGGFGPSQAPPADSELQAPPAANRTASRRWLSPTRWLGRP